MDRRFITNSRAADRPIASPPATINDLLATYVAELEADGVPSPLGQPLTLAVIWTELCRLAGEEPPPAVLALLGGSLAA